MNPNRGETDHAFSQSDQDISSNQSDQDTTSGVPTRDTICSDIQLATSTHKADTESNNFSLPRCFCASNEVSHLHFVSHLSLRFAIASYLYSNNIMIFLVLL